MLNYTDGKCDSSFHVIGSVSLVIVTSYSKWRIIAVILWLFLFRLGKLNQILEGH